MLGVRFPPAPGGAEHHILRVSQELMAQGVEVEVVTSDLFKEHPVTWMDEEHREEIVGGIPVTRLPSVTAGEAFHYVIEKRIIGEVMRRKPDVIHAHSYGYYHTIVGALTRRIQRRPFVFTPHFHPAWSMWGGGGRRVLRDLFDPIVGRQTVSAADHMIFVTDLERRQMQEARLLKHDRWSVIPNGVDPAAFLEPDEKALAEFRERFLDVPEKSSGADGIVLYAGRLSTNKGLLQLLDATRTLVKKKPEIRILIVGSDDGLEERLKRKVTEDGLDRWVTFTGHLSDELYPQAYHACDLFILPSEYEAFGIVLLEAMVAGKPCIGSDRGGVPEVISDGETGMIIPYDDPPAIHDAVMKVLSDEKLAARFGKAGKEKALSGYSWSSIATRVRSVYDSVLENF